MALVAADAGPHLLAPACIELLAVLAVTDKGPGHAEHIRLIFPDDFVAECRILEPRRHAHQELSTPGHHICLHSGSSSQIGAWILPGGGKANGMLGILLPLADGQEVDLPLCQPGQLDGILDGDASGLLAADQAFQREIPAQGLLQCIENLQQQPRPALYVAAVFVGTMVAQGRQQLAYRSVPVGVVEREHLKAQLPKELCLLHHGVNVHLHILFGEVVTHRLGARSALTGLWFKGLVHVGPQLEPHGTGHGHGAIEPDGIDHLTEIVVGRRVADIQGGEMGRGHVHQLQVRLHRMGMLQVVDMNHGRTVSGPVCHQGDPLLRGEALGALDKMRGRRRRKQTVFHQHAAHLQRGQHGAVAVFHGVHS